MKEPKIGLALGSGGAKGFAHIGVIKVLREAGIPIHMIVSHKSSIDGKQVRFDIIERND